MRFLVAVTGGKGGTGKSFVATNLAVLLAQRRTVVLADLDLEAPNDHVLLGVSRLENEEPIVIPFPFIDYSRCTRCGVCARVCDTGAIILSKDKTPFVMPRLCSGCRACIYACPFKAITEGGRIIGYSYVTPVKVDEASFTLVTGILREGEEHTPPGVVVTKRRALRIADDLLIVDTGAGTGSHISVSLQGASLVVAVTEPTPLGLHDLKSILEVVHGLGYRFVVVVNRWGIGDDSLHVALAKDYGAESVYRIPFDKHAVKAYVEGRPVVVSYPDSPSARALVELAESIG